MIPNLFCGPNLFDIVWRYWPFPCQKRQFFPSVTLFVSSFLPLASAPLPCYIFAVSLYSPPDFVSPAIAALPLPSSSVLRPVSFTRIPNSMCLEYRFNPSENFLSHILFLLAETSGFKFLLNDLQFLSPWPFWRYPAQPGTHRGSSFPEVPSYVFPNHRFPFSPSLFFVSYRSCKRVLLGIAICWI